MSDDEVSSVHIYDDDITHSDVSFEEEFNSDEDTDEDTCSFIDQFNENEKHIYAREGVYTYVNIDKINKMYSELLKTCNGKSRYVYVWNGPADCTIRYTMSETTSGLDNFDQFLVFDYMVKIGDVRINANVYLIDMLARTHKIIFYRTYFMFSNYLKNNKNIYNCETFLEGIFSYSPFNFYTNHELSEELLNKIMDKFMENNEFIPELEKNINELSEHHLYKYNKQKVDRHIKVIREKIDEYNKMQIANEWEVV